MAVIGQHHGKAPVAAQKNRVGAGHPGANVDDGLTCVLLFLILFALNYHTAEPFFRFRVGGCQRLVLFIACNPFGEARDLLRVFTQHQFLQGVHLVQIAGLEHIQLCHLHIQVALFNDKRVSGGQRLDLGIAESRFVHIVRHTDGGFAGHDLGDEFLLVLHQLVEVSVKRTLGHIAEDLHLLVIVALAHNAAQPLLKVGRPPGAVQVVQGDELILDVCTRAHLLGAAHQHPYLPGADFRKQFLLFGLAVGVMDKRDFILRDTLLHELLFQIVIYVERTVFGGR